MTAKVNLSVASRADRLWYLLRYAAWWLSRSKAVIIGITIVGIAVAVAAVGPFLSPHPYYEINLSERLHPPIWMEGGSWVYPLGADDLGRCLFSRIVYGTRIALMVGGVVTIITATLGSTPIGMNIEEWMSLSLIKHVGCQAKRAPQFRYSA